MLDGGSVCISAFSLEFRFMFETLHSDGEAFVFKGIQLSRRTRRNENPQSRTTN